mmetsp:Transcript_22600/g.37274  ORF Transcript_22600/g.37274 Transcript_22600/m.37274 type:complete len:320 (-) Transcript_22600:509-1468(-)|eukprot:CAMPEP_0184647422 /NCGR_PEP_ID=MMETSP0308-20130426/4345_1 /TAXON_ID=38269 /ORGANISM="Gloeochaete witrockiana, Strain SAG 46.84" /LENGTH=319 /DNA_ID=CAMNT_0027078355 /DNA_START=184 /DNA_END=1143 /DNA_ORIENTATION=-
MGFMIMRAIFPTKKILESARNSAWKVAISFLIIGVFCFLIVSAYQDFAVPSKIPVRMISSNGEDRSLPMQKEQASLRIFGFYHVAQVAHWRQIVEEQVRLLELSGLLENTSQITVGLLGQDANYHPSPREPKFRIVHDKDVTLMEFFTLDLLRNHCQQKDAQKDILYYFHDKGVTRGTSACISDWRKILEYFVIERWRDCYAALANDIGDTCGALFYNYPKARFYAGNFWWSTCKHINTLPEFDRSRYTNAETWLGMSPVRMINCHQFCADPYKTEHPAFLYRGENCSMPYNIITDNMHCDDAYRNHVLKGLAILDQPA